MAQPIEWRMRTRTLSTADHTLVMGVLNVTPDSFSDGGRFGSGDRIDHGAAIAAGLEMWRDGADLVDVGGESTRPGSTGVSIDEELERVGPVVAGLASEGVVVSIDTTKPDVAEAALVAGAEVVNDVTALASDEMAEVCARLGAGVVLMHMQGTPATMQLSPAYSDVVAEVRDFLSARADAAVGAGIDRGRLCIDPGIGFGKTHEGNLELLSCLGTLVRTGYPVLVGASRKSFLGSIVERAGHPAAAPARDDATSATTALAIASGAAVVRIHDVVAGVQAARTADAIVRAAGRADPNRGCRGGART